MDLGALALLVLGFALLVTGAEALVRGASRLALTAGISSLVVGLTVVAFGTSAPEFAVSLQGALSGQADLALGNVVGSNIFNVLVVLGLSSLFGALVVQQKLVWFDVPLMIGIGVLALLFGLDGRIARIEGTVLLALFLAYTIWSIVTSRRESAAVIEEYEHEYPRPARERWYVDVALIIVGLALLVVGARWLVSGAITIAEALGVSELVIGLTIVAAGTSMPELATSVIAAVRGERDIAVGNVVGSNLFNLTAVLGAAAVVAPGGVAVAAQTLRLDFLVMLAAFVACLPVFLSGHRIGRAEGGLFLAAYIAYMVVLLA